MIGVAPEELIGRTIGEVLGDPEVQALQEEMFAPAMRGDQVIEFERYFPQTEIWADIRVYPSAEGVAVYGRDITERRVAAEALRHERERAELMAMLLDESSQPFGIGRLDGGMGLVNRAFEQLTGYSAEELRSVSWATKLTPPEYANMESEKLEELIGTGVPVRYEKEYVRKDGARVPVELLVHLLKSDDDEPRDYYAFVTDLTERKERERLDVAFNEIRTAIGGTLELSEIVRAALAAGAKALGADSAVTYTRSIRGWSVTQAIGVPKSMGAGPYTDAEALGASIVALEKRAIAINDPAEDARLSQALIRRYRVKSILAAPLGVEGIEFGVLAFYHRKKHEAFTRGQLEFAAKVARAVTIAIQNAMLYQRERTIADTLQEALLLPLGAISGIETSVLYKPASSTADVGGDFYDVFAIGAHECAIVVGDVSGKGLDAARLTSLMHDGLRAYSLETAEPDKILYKLNRLVCQLTPPEQFATLFFGVLNLESGLLRYSTAGHPAPAVIRSSGAEFLPGSRSPLMGAFANARFDCLDAQLAPGERLVLFTDGVTEARRGTELLGETRLLKLLVKMTRTPVNGLPQRLLDGVLAFSGGSLRDDTVILVVARKVADDPER